MAKRPKHYQLDEPLLHAAHKRPVTRRDFLGQGLIAGVGTVLAPSVLSLLGVPRSALGALSSDIADMQVNDCAISELSSRKIPFICFDLAGGANIAGSNVLVGKQGGQLDFLTTAGYNKLGLPGDRIPPLLNPATGTNDFIDTNLGLAFHSESAMLAGILEKAVTAVGSVNGAVIPARSENDTGNNPHNPMYGVYKAGADGALATLIGSRSADSGANSMAPATMIELDKRPTKVDRPSDVTGMVDTGDLISLMSQDDAVRVMESMVRISKAKLDLATIDPKTPTIPPGETLSRDELIKLMTRCGYVKSAYLVDRYADPSALDPAADPLIKGATGIFSDAEFDGDSEFRKTASVMKMVIDGEAGAGTITMGGYDYHTGDRATGERRDLRAGRCIGACLEYAALKGVPLMIYVYSDGSVASNGMIDDSADGGGKGVWTGDNSSTAASFFLVYNPGGAPTLMGGTPEQQARHQQIGWFRGDASVETASSLAANNVNLLAEVVVLNYLALHDEAGRWGEDFKPGNKILAGLAGIDAALRDSLIAFEPIVSGTITVP